MPQFCWCSFRRSGSAGIADGPHAAVELAGDVLDQRLVVVDRICLVNSSAKPSFFASLYMMVCRAGFEQRLDHLVAPLQERFDAVTDP